MTTHIGYVFKVHFNKLLKHTCAFKVYYLRSRTPSAEKVHEFSAYCHCRENKSQNLVKNNSLELLLWYVSKNKMLVCRFP